MRKPKLSLLAVSVSVASLLLASTASFAGEKHHYKENYKGEALPPCPVELMIKDGLYVGLQAGYDSYRVVDDAVFTGPVIAAAIDPRLAVTGAVGGLFIGYGKYFDQYYNAYLGLEIFGNWSGAHSSSDLTVATVTDTLSYNTSVKVKDNYGIDVIPGIKINNGFIVLCKIRLQLG